MAQPKNDKVDAGTGEIVSMEPRFADEQLSEVKSFEDAMQLLGDAGVVAETMDDYGSGFVVTDKDELVGVTMLAMEWRFNLGDKLDDTGAPTTFVSVTAVCKDGRKVIINDSGSGIRDQLLAVTAKRERTNHATPHKGLLFPRGLKKSSYFKEGVGNAETFYIG